MVERLSQTETPTIRFHHLGLWGFFVRDYTEAFGGLKPWELSAIDRGRARSFISNFVTEDAKDDLGIRGYFEELTVTDKCGQKDLAYLRDLIGTTSEEFEAVRVRRIATFNKIFDAVSMGENSTVILNTAPDDFCRSCAVGKHCERRLAQKIFKFDKDFTYMKILRKMIRTGKPQEYSGREMIRWGGKDMIYIKGRALFDYGFHQYLLSEIFEINKEAWMIE
jgi:hypothetical protein